MLISGDVYKRQDQALANTDDKMKQTRKDLFYYKASALYKEEDYSGASAVCEDVYKRQGVFSSR